MNERPAAAALASQTRYTSPSSSRQETQRSAVQAMAEGAMQYPHQHSITYSPQLVGTESWASLCSPGLVHTHCITLQTLADYTRLVQLLPSYHIPPNWSCHLSPPDTTLLSWWWDKVTGQKFSHPIFLSQDKSLWALSKQPFHDNQ